MVTYEYLLQCLSDISNCNSQSLVENNKHLMTGPKENSEFCFPLRKTNEPPPPSSDQAPAEVSVPICPQSNELLTNVPEEVNPPAPSQETAPLSRPEVAPTSSNFS